MIRKIFSGWFTLPRVSPLEGFFMRLLFALALICSLLDPKFFNFTTEPHPVGLLKILHKISDQNWLTWLSNPGSHDIYLWTFVGLMVLYVAGVALPVVLPLASLLHVLPVTLFNSQGYTYHGHAMISLVLLAQACTVLYYTFTQRVTFKAPDEKLRSWIFVQSVMIVTGAYFVSVIAKMEYSHGMWFWNCNNVALDMVKTMRQTYYNSYDPNFTVIPDTCYWMLDHPWTARIFFSTGVVAEVLCLLSIGNRAMGLFWGVMLITMHRFIYPLMGGVAFPFNELMDFIFLIGLPYGLAWVFERIPNVLVRYALIAGAGIGTLASYWLQTDFIKGKFNLHEYFLELVRCLTVWSYQDWGPTLAFIRPAAITAVVGALVFAAIAKVLPSPQKPAMA